MNTHIRAVVKNPGEPAVEKMIDADLESLQRLVGGYIECVSVGKGVDMFVNEEGLLIDLPLNKVVSGHTLVGTIVAISCDDEGESIGLNDEQLSYAMTLLS
jgi:hypothetical protein